MQGLELATSSARCQYAPVFVLYVPAFMLSSSINLGHYTSCRIVRELVSSQEGEHDSKDRLSAYCVLCMICISGSDV